MSLMISGLLLMRTAYSVSPTLMVPAGTIRFCRLNAFDTSIGR